MLFEEFEHPDRVVIASAIAVARIAMCLPFIPVLPFIGSWFGCDATGVSAASRVSCFLLRLGFGAAEEYRFCHWLSGGSGSAQPDGAR